MTSKKIALCLSGKIGNVVGKSGYHNSDMRILQKSFEHYDRHILQKNNVDVFVHCWDEQFKEEVDKLYKPKLSKYEKQIYFDIPSYVKGKSVRKNNHYSRWYSNFQAINLKKQYEKENNMTYDFVMLTRFDLAFEKDVVFDLYNDQKFYAGNWSAVYDSYGRDIFKGGRGPLYSIDKNTLSNMKLKYGLKGYPHTKDGFLDLWFFSNSENSNKFFSLYNHLNEYTKPGNCPLDAAGTISNHQLAKYHLREINLLNKLDFTLHMYDDFALTRRKYFDCRK